MHIYLGPFPPRHPSSPPAWGREKTMGKLLFAVFIGILIGAYLSRDRALFPIML